VRVLAIDTCLDACQAALLDDDRVVFARSEPMHRGHQERLAPMLAEAMAEVGAEFAHLDRIGVTVGPGSFTGLRVGIAFAKGLAIALGIPCVGVGVLDALAAGGAARGPLLAVIDAKRDQVYVQLFHGKEAGRAEAVLVADLPGWLERRRAPGELTAIGSGAALVATASAVMPLPAPDPVAVARLAAAANPAEAPPRPIYLRPPDARLPA
jgi:tRNA threonylcarbamoyladenosine biosynthesis protein TsaB